MIYQLDQEVYARTQSFLSLLVRGIDVAIQVKICPMAESQVLIGY